MEDRDPTGAGETGSTAQRAVAEERLRIARELHDTVAHNVSLMVVEARALGATAGNAELRHLAEEIEELGREAIDQMHSTVGFLRARPGGVDHHAPQASLANLPGLVAHSRTAGLQVEMTVRGERRALPPEVDRAAFRIVQEALTNALRHAEAVLARVEIGYGQDAIRLVIESSSGGPPEPARGDGLGLIGMRERVALLSGAFDAHAVPGGFLVEVTLPYAGAELG